MPDYLPQVLALGSFLGSVALALWQAYQWLSGQYDKRNADREAADDRQQAMLSGQRDKIAADLRLDLNACRADLDATAKDRNRGWDLARRYHEMLYHFHLGWREAVGEARSARQTAESIARRAATETGDLAPVWANVLESPPAMPPFDDLKP